MQTLGSMEQVEVVVNGVSRSVACIACAAMAILYVALLYAPTLILRLPPSTSYNSFLVRRFICAAIASVVSIISSALILSVNPFSLCHLRFFFFFSSCFSQVIEHQRHRMSKVQENLIGLLNLSCPYESRARI